MKYLMCSGVLLMAVGCGKSEFSKEANATQYSQTAIQGGRVAGTVEEFEGVVELFGKELRARRQVALDEEGNYVKHGWATAWYETGQKAGEMAFHYGKPHGAQKVWHENGKKKLHSQWENGMAQGKWTEWYDNGQIKSSGTFADGKMDGSWKYWDTDGQVTDEVQYRAGEKVSVAGRTSKSRF